MSQVTNIILTHSVCERENPDETYEIHGLLASSAVLARQGSSLKDVSAGAGGTKCLEAVVLLGAFNYLDLDAFVDAVQALPWETPEGVRLYAQEQDDYGFCQVLLDLPGQSR